MNSTPILPTDITAGSNDITALRVTEYVLFTIIFIINVIGNVLVCLVIYKTPSMRTTRNYLIVNLAVADLTVALVCIPFDVVIKVYAGSPWPLGVAMCKVVWPSMTLVTTCSAATLLAISYDRYQAVIRLWKFSSLQTTAVIAATWLLSLLLVIPYIVALRITENGKCSEEWLSTTIRQLYTLGLFVFQYALPLFFIAIAYAAVVIKLHKQANDLIGGKGLKREYSRRRDGGLLLSSLSKESPSTRSTYPNFPAVNAKSEAKRIERNKKIVKMLMSVVSLYAICLLPNQVVWLWMEFRSRESFNHLDHSLLTFSSLLVYINSSINPMLYAGMNKEFRKGFAKALGFRLKTQGKKRTKRSLKHDVA